MRILIATCVAALSLLAGCASANRPGVELKPIDGLKVEYTGEIGETSNLGEMPEFTGPENETEYGYTLETRFLRMTLDTAHKHLGERAGEIGAFEMPNTDIEKLDGVEVITAPRLTVFEGQAGYITITNETAYISGFEIQGKNATRVADPVVETVMDGIVLSIRADHVSEGRMSLSLDMTLSELVRPIATQNVKVFGAPVQIQTPVVVTQRLKASGEVGENRSFILTGMVGAPGRQPNGDDEITVVLFRSERLEINRDPEKTPDIGQDD